MNEIIYIDRLSKQKRKEKIYGGKALERLYSNPFLRVFCLPLIAKLPFFSALYGWWQKRSVTHKKITPFICEFGVDSTEFLEPDSYKSFNDFFIRKLRPECRPIAQDPSVAIMPADGRYLFYQNISLAKGFWVKGKKFNLRSLLEDDNLAEEYREGSLILARLCPSDYHRFHFPCGGIVGGSRLINGWLYSVNPMALRRDITIFTQNKRAITEIFSPDFGKVLFIEIGATCVGSIHQTYQANEWQSKGAEKGYFSFGGSSLILLFAKGTIEFDSDLLESTQQGLEMRCLMGQRMGQRMRQRMG